MIHEYALDPELFSDWPTARYLLDQFGAQHGRMISQFPNKWKRQAYEACAGCSPIDRKRIEERLKNSDTKLIRMGRDFDGEITWIRNAERSHADRPFRLIISRSESASDGVVDPEELGPCTPEWTPDEGSVPRNATALANAALPLLIGAKTICLVDPHFSCAARHCKPLENIVKLVCLHSTAKVIQYHILAKSATAAWFEGQLTSRQLHWVRQALQDRKIHFIRWRQRAGGESFHARFIMTDRGGLLYENGLDEGSGQETTAVLRMDESLWRSRYEAYAADSGTYELVDAFCLTSGGAVSKTAQSG